MNTCRQLGVTGAACALWMLAATAAASPQTSDTDASDDALETVEITGIRRGIQDAIEIKREATSIVEAISAEDLGKLPDTSIAESISRLPGLTSQRAEGRSSAISLRGTDPGFTGALLNGREQVSTGDNRNIEFEQYPSELLSAVVVYKTPDAALVGQGLAGTIDLRTTRPIAYGRRAMAFNIRAEQNSHDDLGADSDDKGYRVSFSYIDQFLDDRLGIAFGVARLDQPLAVEGAGTYEPWHANGTPDAGGGNPTGQVNPGVGPGVFVTDGIKVRTDMGSNRRDGAMAALEWRPSESYASILDLYYTKRDQENNARSLEVNLGGYPAPCCDGTFPVNTVFGYSNPTVVDNTVVAATLNQRVPLARNFLFETEDEIFAAGWNNRWALGDWTVEGDVSYSEATRDERQFETNAQFAPVAAMGGAPQNVYDSGQFEITNGDMPTLNFNLNYADPASVRVGPTIYGAGYSKIPHVTDELTSGRFDVSRTIDSGWFSSVVAGINYADRTKDKLQPEGGLSTLGNGYFQIESQYLLSPTNLGYADAGGALAWDVPGVLAAYYQPIVYGSPTDLAFSYLIGKNWAVEEKVSTAFLKSNLNHDLSDDVSIKGNLGVQIVRTDQSSNAHRLMDEVDPDVIVPYSDGKEYTDVLPAINVAFLFPERQAFRVGIARELARARMDQLKASSDQGYDAGTGIPGGVGGDPRLDPWRADAFDMSYEKYLGNNGYVSVAAFYKKLKTYIYNQTDATHDFSNLLAQLPANYFAPGVTPRTTGSFSGPVNGQGGTLKGLELSTSLTGEMFSDALSGFGAILSVSRTESGIRIQDPPGNNFLTGNNLGEIPLPGLSETVWNATLYYEKAGFSARVATRARSDYVGEVVNFASDRALKRVNGEQITDAQLGYEFQEGRFQGLSILLQGNNLTDEPYIAYALTETRQQDYQRYGRQIMLGLNYRL